MLDLVSQLLQGQPADDRVRGRDLLRDLRQQSDHETDAGRRSRQPARLPTIRQSVVTECNLGVCELGPVRERERERETEEGEGEGEKEKLTRV